MITGFPPLPLVGGITGAIIVSTPSLTLALTANNATLTPFGSTGVIIPAATSTAAGMLDAPRATIIDALPAMPLATVAKTGVYSDLIGEPSSIFGVSFIVDGGGIPITTGLKGFLIFPYAATITSWALIADVQGSIAIDLWKANAAVPVIANSIVAGNLPLLASQQYSGVVSPLNWTSTAIAINDVMGFNVSSTGGVIQRVTLALQVTHL